MLAYEDTHTHSRTNGNASIVIYRRILQAAFAAFKSIK